MAEFQLIEAIVQALGKQPGSSQLVLGPGDDAAILALPAQCEVVTSIDTLVADRHFPAAAAPALVGYRALMVAASDLAAMAAEPGFATVALTMPDDDPSQTLALATGLAEGLAEAARAIGLPIVGGNLSRGPLTLSISVQGYVPFGRALRRDGAGVDDLVLVSGPLGGSAAALRLGEHRAVAAGADASLLSPLQRAYYRPRARLDLVRLLRGQATAAIDLSDGLLQDLGHLCQASGLGAELVRAAIPLVPGANLGDACGASDDYELCFTLPPAAEQRQAELLAVGCRVIGRLTRRPGLRLDGVAVDGPTGFDHFAHFADFDSSEDPTLRTKE